MRASTVGKWTQNWAFILILCLQEFVCSDSTWQNFLSTCSPVPGLQNCLLYQVALVVRTQCGSHKRRGFNPWVGRIPWSREWEPTPVFLPAESQGQRSLVGYSPRGRKESDMTE